MCNTIALTFNAFVNPIAIEAIAWKYYLVYIAFLVVITLVVYLFYAETKGLSLEEISEVFEGPIIVAGLHRQRHTSVDRRSEDVKDGVVEEIVEHSENPQG